MSVRSDFVGVKKRKPVSLATVSFERLLVLVMGC
jgi:hypothetical protein